MKRKSITAKLFLLTVIFFGCFYIMIIASHLLFFNSFYQEYRVNKVERALDKFAKEYSAAHWNGNETALHAAKYMSRSRSQLAIINANGDLVLEDPYRIDLELSDGRKMMVSLSVLMNQYGDELRSANIRVGDRLTIWGEIDEREGHTPVLYPEKIEKQGTEVVVGKSLEPETEPLTGTVLNILLPNIKNWSQRQGLLMSALSETFPLSAEAIHKVESMEKLKLHWVEAWSGMNNQIIIQPVTTSAGEVQLLFSVTSFQEIKDANEAMRWFYFYLGIGGFALILILALFYSKMVTKPLLALNRMAKKMVRLDFTALTPLRKNDELGNLSESLFTMSRELDKALRELKEANHQLQHDMEQKERMETIQRDFFSNASHELKTPISIIKSYAEGLQDGVSVHKKDHYISVILEEADKLEMLTRTMLDLARLESGTTPIARKSFLLSELVEKVADKLTYLLKERGLAIVVIPTNELPVWADPELMEQVMINLLTNAIRHAEEGSPITVEIQSDEKTSRLSVKNKGEPIPEAQLSHIWERFYRGEASRSRQTGGTGLGLSIAKHILDLHGCEYGVSNEPDGVRFTISFPGRG
ncbi:ATP-binding protein [Gorillibacterium sp. CAU 1737]|uniref:sensor histidine kinase n=1 Tax=Gorillibacterium sp. CAU 1737 TaxID=3140362 RepID=UPI0032608010